VRPDLLRTPEKPTLLAGQNLGVKNAADNIWVVSFLHYETCRLESTKKPFGRAPAGRH